jgi:hypothetical protein
MGPIHREYGTTHGRKAGGVFGLGAGGRAGISFKRFSRQGSQPLGELGAVEGADRLGVAVIRFPVKLAIGG